MFGKCYLKQLQMAFELWAIASPCWNTKYPLSSIHQVVEEKMPPTWIHATVTPFSSKNQGHSSNFCIEEIPHHTLALDEQKVWFLTGPMTGPNEEISEGALAWNKTLMANACSSLFQHVMATTSTLRKAHISNRKSCCQTLYELAKRKVSNNHTLFS